MDICHCASTKCEMWDSCLRGKYARMFDSNDFCTSSFLSEICNKDNDYAEFIMLYDDERRKLESCNR